MLTPKRQLELAGIRPKPGERVAFTRFAVKLALDNGLDFPERKSGSTVITFDAPWTERDLDHWREAWRLWNEREAGTDGDA